MSLTGVVIAAYVTAGSGILLAIFSQYIKVRNAKQDKLDDERAERDDFNQRLLAYLEKFITERYRLTPVESGFQTTAPFGPLEGAVAATDPDGNRSYPDHAFRRIPRG